ncbi:hypothetical protein CEUSTIGMA_g1014.t1 [Chlamydomonas eustigma]|uniref:Glutathione synthetase n=1 Tax=Chlamydomonas eustigma TaxID=1157962 RepID=A0A250WRX8_9CHLO|nr:hypothetical protein CEUSTIGMA_g1014.t1 [Chlamydomonas eustigma]|eukprot:GAX73563.1 hypothetical protein CEUSTIGMA_g1014.t1 [Chlamydomonas eustigma]
MMSTEETESIVQDAIVWANQHGLVVALKDKAFVNPECATVHVPLAALPVAFPEERFLQAKAVMPLFNRVIDRVAADEAYLERTLAAAAKFDDFTRRLLQLLVATRSARQALAGGEIALGINRSDYMLDEPSGGFLQVELNTIASSFGCLSSLMTHLHTYLSSRVPYLDASRLPLNTAIDGIPAAIAAAAKAHGVAGGVVVMIVQPGERNAYDQQWIQLQLWERHGLRTYRRTLGDIATKHSQLGHDGQLQVEGQPVSVIYFRAGYTPDDYPSESEWRGREIIECSNAAKCPTVAYQLAGAKKVQQDLARTGVVEQFTESADEARQLRSFFAGLWGLDDVTEPSTADAVGEALRNPDRFVLKPQREGGGNNLYGADLVSRLSQPEGLSAFILMQKIRPPAQSSVLVRNGQWAISDTLSEVGIYGTFLKKGKEVLLNEEVGHLVRTKRTDSNEGGVAAGFAVLDSPYLV